VYANQKVAGRYSPRAQAAVVFANRGASGFKNDRGGITKFDGRVLQRRVLDQSRETIVVPPGRIRRRSSGLREGFPGAQNFPLIGADRRSAGQLDSRVRAQLIFNFGFGALQTAKMLQLTAVARFQHGIDGTTALTPKFRRTHPEVFAKIPREAGVGSKAQVQGDVDDFIIAPRPVVFQEAARRFAQTSSANIVENAEADAGVKEALEVKAGIGGMKGDRIKIEIFGQSRFDIFKRRRDADNDRFHRIVSKTMKPSKTLKLRPGFTVDFKVLKAGVSPDNLPMGHLPVVIQDVNRNLIKFVLKTLNPDRRYFVSLDELDLGFAPEDPEYSSRLVGLFAAARELNRAGTRSSKRIRGCSIAWA
jgi:hypothetical protein